MQKKEAHYWMNGQTIFGTVTTQELRTERTEAADGVEGGVWIAGKLAALEEFLVMHWVVSRSGQHDGYRSTPGRRSTFLSTLREGYWRSVLKLVNLLSTSSSMVISVVYSYSLIAVGTIQKPHAGYVSYHCDDAIWIQDLDNLLLFELAR